RVARAPYADGAVDVAGRPRTQARGLHRSRSSPRALERYPRGLRASHLGTGRATSARLARWAWVARPSKVPPAAVAYGREARSGSDWSRSYTARSEARLAPRSRSGLAMPRAASPARCPA